MILHTKDRVEYDIKDSDILLNDCILPEEFNPHNVQLWIIGNEYGPIVALWAGHEQDALDILLDSGYEQFLVDEPDPEMVEEYAYLGNAGEPCNLNYAWMSPVEFDKVRDYRLLIVLAEARGACQNTLG